MTTKLIKDMTAQDWQKPAAVIAAVLGVTERRAYALKNEHGAVKQKAGRKAVLDWDNVNWALSSQDIATLYDVAKSTVDARRRRHAPTNNAALDWDLADWSQSNDDLASQMGVTPAAASYNRNERKKRNNELSDHSVKHLAKLLAKRALLTLKISSLALSVNEQKAFNSELKKLADGITPDSVNNLDDILQKVNDRV